MKPSDTKVKASPGVKMGEFERCDFKRIKINEGGCQPVDRWRMGNVWEMDFTLRCKPAVGRKGVEQ